MKYVVLKPDKAPLGIYEAMVDAQLAIACTEPDVVAQGLYQIHPVADEKALNDIGLKIEFKVESVHKFEGDTLIETVIL